MKGQMLNNLSGSNLLVELQDSIKGSLYSADGPFLLLIFLEFSLLFNFHLILIPTVMRWFLFSFCMETELTEVEN